jgi:hypothetical protein
MRGSRIYAIVKAIIKGTSKYKTSARSQKTNIRAAMTMSRLAINDTLRSGESSIRVKPNSKKGFVAKSVANKNKPSITNAVTSVIPIEAS